MISKSNEQITVTLQKVIYVKQDSRWHIIKTDKGTAKGTINFEVKEGDILQLEGYSQISKFNGEQEFIFTQAMLSIPEDPRALLHYAVELTKGLGQASEQRIWELYGESWRDDLELAELPRMTKEIIFAWHTTLTRLKEQKEQTQAISFLISKGATMNLSCAAWERWTEKTISIVQGDCYMLADLPHYGFCDIDQGIRKQFGIADADPRRIEAATIYVMNQISQAQGSLIERKLIVDELIKIIPDAYQMFDICMNKLEAAKRVVILDVNNFALMEDWQNEEAVYQRLCA